MLWITISGVKPPKLFCVRNRLHIHFYDLAAQTTGKDVDTIEYLLGNRIT